jgi:hypothetical protein
MQTHNGKWDVTSGKNTNRGPIKYVPDEFVNALAELPLRSKVAIPGLAQVLGVCQGQAHLLRRKMTKMIKIAPSRVATTKLGIQCGPPHQGSTTGLWPVCLF